MHLKHNHYCATAALASSAVEYYAYVSNIYTVAATNISIVIVIMHLWVDILKSIYKNSTANFVQQFKYDTILPGMHNAHETETVVDAIG